MHYIHPMRFLTLVVSLLLVCTAHAAPTSTNDDPAGAPRQGNGLLNRLGNLSERVEARASELVVNAMGLLGVPYKRGAAPSAMWVFTWVMASSSMHPSQVPRCGLRTWASPIGHAGLMAPAAYLPRPTLQRIPGQLFLSSTVEFQWMPAVLGRQVL